MIIWEKARFAVEKIEADLRKNFDIIFFCEVNWNPELAKKNMSRFYGKKLHDIDEKVEHCGIGSFIVYQFVDPLPDWCLIQTTSGFQRVNKNAFDAKQRYREMTGGGHRIHATNNQAETIRDIVLLFGVDHIPSLNKKTIQRDIVGATSWRSLSEVFEVLNSSAPYIVMRNFENLPDQHDNKIHGDIDILCLERTELFLLLNARQVFQHKYRRYNMITVGDVEVPVDIRDVNEGYYCKKWSNDLIARRVLLNGIFIPGKKDHLYSLAYHVLVHKSKVTPDYCNFLLGIWDEKDVDEYLCDHMDFLAKKLRIYMKKNGYKFIRPYDWSVYFNYSEVDEVGVPWMQLLLAPPKTLKHISREFKAIFLKYYRNTSCPLIKRYIRVFKSFIKQFFR